jgi:hypothetical protein
MSTYDVAVLILALQTLLQATFSCAAFLHCSNVW